MKTVELYEERLDVVEMEDRLINWDLDLIFKRLENICEIPWYIKNFKKAS